MSTIETRALSKSYFLGPVEVPVLQDLDLKIERGEQIAVVGPSGVGKSTLLHLLGALDRPTSGEILIDDRALSSMSPDELAALRNGHIGFVFQFHHLLPEFTALENVLLPAGLAGNAASEEVRNRAKELLSLVGLSHRVGHRPGELSGGECLRVAVARALINRPGILIADEPTGNLDGEAAFAIQKLMEDLARQDNTTLIVATHNPDFAKSVDRIVHLKEHHVVEG